MTNETTQPAAVSYGAWNYQSSATASKVPAQLPHNTEKETQGPSGGDANAAPVTS